VVFYELDFGEVVKRKSNVITTCRELHELIAHNEAGIRVTEGTRAKMYITFPATQLQRHDSY
jgi:hypothetical protein